jgi:hypothetical protein
MMRTVFIEIILLVFLLSCNEGGNNSISNTNADSLNAEISRITFIKDTNETNHITGGQHSFWIPTQNQLIEIDSMVIKAIRNKNTVHYKHLKPGNLKDYYRQYVCYIASNGDSLIYINALWKIGLEPPSENNITKSERWDWQHYMIYVKDGGDSFWNLRINFSKKKYLELNINGLTIREIITKHQLTWADSSLFPDAQGRPKPAAPGLGTFAGINKTTKENNYRPSSYAIPG